MSTFCDSLADFVPYFWECCPSGRTTKINRKKPHFTIIEQRQVFWAAQPNEHHYSGSVWPIQEPIFSESAVKSSPAAFLRCSTFPCSLPKQARWLTAPTAPASCNLRFPTHKMSWQLSAGANPGRETSLHTLLLKMPNGGFLHVLARTFFFSKCSSLCFFVSLILTRQQTVLPLLKHSSPGMYAGIHTSSEIMAPAISKENQIDAICSACSF